MIYNRDHNISYNWIDPSPGLTKELLFFTSFANIFFSFGVPVGALPIYKGLKNNIIRRVEKVFLRSVITEGIVFIFLGTCGYLSVPLDTPPLIVYRTSIFNSDWILSIGKVLLILTVLFSYAPNFICIKITIIDLFFPRHRDNIPFVLNMTITLVIILSSTTIGCLYSNITSYLAILGGFLAVIIANGFPALLYLKVSDTPMSSWKSIFIIVFNVIYIGAGWFAGFITILNIIRGSDGKNQ